jgi:hypothetical protein
MMTAPINGTVPLPVAVFLAMTPVAPVGAMLFLDDAFLNLAMTRLLQSTCVTVECDVTCALNGTAILGLRPSSKGLGQK